MSSPVNPDRLVTAVPHNGHLIHAVFDRPREREQMALGHLRMHSTALCGVSGRTTWGGGWRVLPTYKDPDPFDPADPKTCRRCARLYRKADREFWQAMDDPAYENQLGDLAQLLVGAAR